MSAHENHSWNVRFEISEDEQHCDMVVHLDTGLQQLTGRGRSRRNPTDMSMPRVGEELAAARAFHDLANHLAEDAWAIIEAASHANS